MDPRATRRACGPLDRTPGRSLRSTSRRLAASRRWPWLVAASLLAATKAPAQSFDAADVVLDPATGLEWLRVSESVGRSYDDLVGNDGSDELAPGGDFAGFRHATVAEAESFLANAGFDVLETASTDLLDEARSLQARLGGPTLVAGDSESLFALTSDDSIAAGSRDRILVGIDNAAMTGQAGLNGAIADGGTSPSFGHLLVRDAAPLPERHVYVARSSESGIEVIDAATLAVVDTVATPVRAFAITVSPDQRRVYALNVETSNAVVFVIDTATRMVADTFPYTASGTARDILTSADGSLLFITDQDDPGEVLVLDAATGAALTPIAVERFPYALARSPDGSQVYVTSPNTLEVSVVDAAMLMSVTTSDVNRFQFAIDVGELTGQLYSARSSTAYETSPVTLTGTPSVSVGADIRGVAASETIGRLFASSNDDATVDVVDLDGFSVLTTIPTGTVALHGGILAPGIDVTAEGDLVFAAQGDNDAVVAIDTLSNRVVATIPAGDSPIDVVVVPEPAAAALGALALGSLAALGSLSAARGGRATRGRARAPRSGRTSRRACVPPRPTPPGP